MDNISASKEIHDCTQLRGLSSDYVDGELDTQTSGGITHHLQGCPPCLAFIETLKATISLIKDPQGKKAPDGLRARLFERLRGAN